MSRSTAYRQTKDRPRFYRRAEDEAVLAEIRKVIRKRGSYGYRRVTVLLRRAGKRYNKKRIRRVMRMHGLQIPAKNRRRTGRAHTGRIETDRSNVRWCSDAFEIHCWNGEEVHVGFALDCCDREAIAFVARPRDLTAEDVRELMSRAVRARFPEGRPTDPDTLVRYDVFDRCLAEGRGVIVIIGHLGNWEIGGLASTLAGYPLYSLNRPIDNPWMDRYLMRFRTQTGQHMISRDRALGEMIRALQKNKMLVVQVDQDARQVGVFVNFFGRPASTHRAPATLSLKYNAPVVLVDTYREGLMNYAVCSDPIYPDPYRDRPDPVKALTQAYSDAFEACVRRHPEQWFWMHDRWKTAERTARKTTEALV